MRARGRSGRTAAILLALASVAVACTGDDDDGAAPDPAPRPPTTTTTRVDLSGVGLAPAPGETTTTAAQSGRAAIVGTVRGPAGPAAGATVRIQRLGPGGGSADVQADGEGRFVHRGVPGGRYRVRAWLPPSLAQTEAEVRFLADDQEHRFDLSLQDHSGSVVMVSAAPDPPVLDQPVNLVVQVGARRVDGDGIVRAEPVSGLRVELSGLGRWELDDVAPASGAAITDGAGRARFALVCRVPGPPALGVRFAVGVAGPPPPAAGAEGEEPPVGPETRTESVGLDLPACVDLTPPPTTTPEPTDNGGGDNGGGDNGGGDNRGGADDGDDDDG
jgi:hypothetical protein